MNKRGDGFTLVGEKTLNIIIAIACLIALAYLLFSLYSSSQQSKELELAQSSLSYLMDKIKVGALSVDIYNPSGWWIMHWTQSTEMYAEKKAGYTIPPSCSGLQPENCLCFCPEESFGCVGGICTDSDGYLVLNPIQIENPPITLSINQQSKVISKT